MLEKSFRIIQKLLLTLVCLTPFVFSVEAQTPDANRLSVSQELPTITGARQINPTTMEVLFSDDQILVLDFYGSNIFRMFQDNEGGIMRDPEAKPEAQILVDNPRKAVNDLSLADDASAVTITTDKIAIRFDKATTLFTITNLLTDAVVVEEISPISIEKDKSVLKFKEHADEYFYGGGVQNGRFSHKGKVISIENQNSWTDGGVASPTPFYWSTQGYGVMWYTFKKGKYDFGANEKGVVELHHEAGYLDVFLMINDGIVALLNDFYQLTGNPVLLPKFGFYQGHLNAYNRDYWVEDENGILFEDGKKYKESQKDNGGVKESLNGEKDNYQFSARAVIDRYKAHDMPLGWLLPNDGYGAGYGQTGTLKGNIKNLRELTDYAMEQGVQIGLWTQSDLYPNPKVEPLLQRDIIKEVRDAGVRLLKTDVAWVGAGYSFGLNGVSNVAHVMSYYGNNSRPFIISLDGWAGTQRYAGIWSGDQTGGAWEYIRFHIPTYIGSGLSGQPNISSDMDGIFGGNKPIINTRDFQWKTFSPMELNMDGWGANPKYPHALGESATSINRWYLKWKSELMPYAYSIAEESIDGLPMIRAMFLEYPNSYTKGKATQYQFMYGPYFLIAPIYQETNTDEQGNDIRHGIYLPEGQWIDYFTGELYEGGRILNCYDAPLWKLPVFVKNGAIIPLVNPNNNPTEINQNHRIFEVYPYGNTSFTLYDDDGLTEEYRLGKSATTQIESSVSGNGKATISIHPSVGDFTDFVKEQSTEFRVNVTQKPKKIHASIGKKKVKIKEAASLEEFIRSENAYFYEAAPNLNKHATPGSDFEKEIITKNPLLFVKLASVDITTTPVTVSIDGFKYNPQDNQHIHAGSVTPPANAGVTEENTEAYTLMPTWDKVANADYYEIALKDMTYSTIRQEELLFDGLEAETTYDFQIRSVNKDGYSDWHPFAATTKSNPLEFAIQGIVAESSALAQGRSSSVAKLFDFDENSMWHTKWDTVSIPLDIVADLKTINQLDKFHYLPRIGAGNGTVLKGEVFYSKDKENWISAGAFEWVRDDEVKVFTFSNKPVARYVKLNVTEATGGFGSGRQIYIFKVPNTESYLPGDINNDGKIDQNDLMSYTNYTGLRQGDADFEGYISNGDINENGLIDAYDISLVTTRLNGGAKPGKEEKVEGQIEMISDKQSYKKGETVEIIIKGTDLRSVNAISFALPYSPQDYEYVGIEPLNMKAMESLTNDRLHTSGVKALYPTYVNLGNQELLEGTIELFKIKLKAQRDIRFDLEAVDGILVDKSLNTQKF